MIKQIFGVLKWKFHILHLAPEYSLDIQACIPAVLAMIHNFTCHHEPEEEEEDGDGDGDGDGETVEEFTDSDKRREPQSFTEKKSRRSDARIQSKPRKVKGGIE